MYDPEVMEFLPQFYRVQFKEADSSAQKPICSPKIEELILNNEELKKRKK